MLRPSFSPWLAWLVCPVVVGVACLPTRPEGDVVRVIDQEKGGAGGEGPVQGTGGSIAIPTSTGTQPVPTDPHSLAGADPPHGRFAGGVRVLLQGSGFAGKPRVWFGASEVPASDVVVISKTKLQVVAPAGQPGLVDVAVQNGDDASTRRTLVGGFTYDPFYVDPDNGPSSGGTVVTLVGSTTGWQDGVAVKIGDRACESVQVAGPESLTCVTAPASPGVRAVTVTPSGGEGVVVADAFAYADSDNGYRGGLSGKPLPPPPSPGQPAAGKLRVLAFDSSQGTPLVGASVFVGKTKVGTIGAEGVVEIEGVVAPAASAGGQPAAARLTVTVARKCAQPQTFAGVSVDTVTMFLDPIKAPECAPPKGDPPPTGGTPGLGSSISGQVSFPEQVETKKPPWDVVPEPKTPSERRVAYLFPASTDPRTTFRLPDPSQGVTEESVLTGGTSFAFSLSTGQVGNLTLYALAGIEDRTKNPPVFTAYGFGVARGVTTKPGQATPDVGLVIDMTLDQAVTLDLSPPVPGPKGPDRLVASVAVNLGQSSYAIFPGAQRTVPLPLGGPQTFVGLPPLSKGLAGLRYVATAVAATGPQLLLPISSVGTVAFTDPSQPIGLGGFVRLPVLTAPAGGAWDGSTLAIAPSGQGVPPQLLLIEAQSGGGLVGWTIVAPGDTTEIELPDLRAVPKAGLVTGPVTFTVSAATLEAFDYQQLRYRHVSRFNWLAYAQDAFYSQLPP